MPKHGLLVGEDQRVADWTFSQWDLVIQPINLALGILGKDGNLVGSVIFMDYNGYNIELWYYGPRTVTIGIARSCAKIALHYFKVARVTLRIPKRNMPLIRRMQKFGFKIEGTEQQFFGPERDAVRLVIFTEGMKKLAGEK
jgi:RimJ/RimL family protein N-acetyltransferase